MKMKQIECSETSEYKIQTPGNYPEESIQHCMALLKNQPESCALLGHYAMTRGNLLPTFRDILPAPSSGFKNKWILEPWGKDR